MNYNRFVYGTCNLEVFKPLQMYDIELFDLAITVFNFCFHIAFRNSFIHFYVSLLRTNKLRLFSEFENCDLLAAHMKNLIE